MQNDAASTREKKEMTDKDLRAEKAYYVLLEIGRS